MKMDVDIIDLGLEPETESLFLAIDIQIRFLEFLNTIESDAVNVDTLRDEANKNLSKLVDK